MPRRYSHLTFEERCQVEIPKKSGLSRGSIAPHSALISDRTAPSLGDEAGCRTSDWNRRTEKMKWNRLLERDGLF